MAGKPAIGKYEILEKIKEGGMGIIYKANHPTLGKPVILKQLTFGSSRILIERFKREAKIMINLRNDNIVPVHDHFKDSHSYYLVMEYVDGFSLEDLLKKYGRLKPEAALIILYQVCKGLKYAHDKGIVHRDVKPDNILISRTGEIKLVDFGIATALAGNEEDLTKTGAVMGTPAYMSPEQLTDSKNVDKQSDIYSLGVVLYYMLTGAKPFPSNFAGETIQKIKRGKYQKARKINPKIPAVCVRIMKKMMHHRKRKRYADLGPVLDKLVELLHVRKQGKVLLRYLRSYLTAGDMKCPVNLKKKQMAYRSSAAALFFLAILTAALYIMIYTGWLYKFILSRNIGAAVVELDIKSSDGLENFIRGASIQNISSADNPDPKHGISFSKSGNSYIWKDYNLKNGYYAFSGFINDVFYYRTFYNYSYSELASGNISENREILPDFSASYVPFSVRVQDEITGKRLLDAYISISDGENVWTDFPDVRLKSGKKYTVSVSHPDYYPQEFSFIYNFGKFSADVSLVPLPGRLYIAGNVEGLQIMIDGEKGGFTGRRKKTWTNYGETAKNSKLFYICTGQHTVTIRKSSKIEKSIEIDLKHDQTIQLRVVYNEAARELQLEY